VGENWRDFIAVAASNGRVLEHSINTFRGCSGAIVFLLDKNQSEAVMEHAGRLLVFTLEEAQEAI